MELEDTEIWQAIKSMKKRKVAGIDGISMETWIFGGSAVKAGIKDLLKHIWKEGVIPMEWRKSVMVPIFKKDDQERTKNYRGISLLCTAYKIYTEVVRRRLKWETEQKKLIPESQGGFRKERGTIDNIFVLNHLIQRESNERKKGKRIYAIFINLKAAFDNVDRKILWKILEENDICKDTIRRLKKAYEGTEVVKRKDKEMSEAFVTSKGVR